MRPQVAPGPPEGQEGVSIDPGGAHVGLAFWLGGVPVGVCTLPPLEALDLVQARLGSGVCRHLAFEGFRLRGGRQALMQAGSSLGVVECIGALKHIARYAGIEPVEVSPGERASVLKRWNAVGAPYVRCDGHGRSALHVGCAAWFPDSSTWTPEWLARLRPGVPLYLA